MIDIAPVAAFVTEFFTWLLDVNKITVLATTASALFAGAICWVNWRQLRHTRNVERAYISGGGPLDKNDPNKFLFTVNNYGKTPGILTEYAVEFCPLDDIPSIPAYKARGYKRSGYHDRIPPGGIRETRIVASIDIPPLPRPLLAYGRYWFQDIWKKRHTSGFVLHAQAQMAMCRLTFRGPTRTGIEFSDDGLDEAMTTSRSLERRGAFTLACLRSGR